MKNLLLLTLVLFTTALFSQTKNKDILLIHAGQRDSKNGVFPAIGTEDYYDQLAQMSVTDPTLEYIAEYLKGLLSKSTTYAAINVTFNSVGTANSLADIYYDPQFASIKSSITQGNYKYVIFFDSEQAYAYPEVMYEACKQLSKPILESGGTPILMMNYSSYVTDMNKLGEFCYRAANGNGLEVIPAAYAIDEAGLQGRKVGEARAKQAMVSASAIYRHITGLDPATANYIPTYEYTNISSASQYALSSATITELANYAKNAVDTNKTTQHYTTSYENDGAVVYRSLAISGAPFNNTVNFFYKGSSTHEFTSDRLITIINNSLTATTNFLGNQNYSTRDWTVDDTTLRATTFLNKKDLGVFLYVGGSDPGATAQSLKDSNQANMIPLVFDWIKDFSSATGVTATTNVLNNEGCAGLWYNYHFRGWKTIPLNIGMGRLNETFSNFLATDDGLHISDPLLYMNASMMIASSMGTKLPIPTGLTTRKGTWTQAQLETAINMGHDLIKELAYMTETSSFIPDSDLTIVTKDIPEIPVNSNFSFQLVASGGTGTLNWSYLSSQALPAGVSLSSTGLLTGTLNSAFTLQKVAFKVTDGVGAIRKVGLNLISTGPLSTLSHQLSDNEVIVYPNPIKSGELTVSLPAVLQDSTITMELYTLEGKRIIQKIYTNTAQDLVLDVNRLSSGNYLLLISNGTTTKTQKVIIN